MTNPPHSFQTAAATPQTFCYYRLVYLRRVHCIKVRLVFSWNMVHLFTIDSVGMHTGACVAVREKGLF